MTICIRAEIENVARCHLRNWPLYQGESEMVHVVKQCEFVAISYGTQPMAHRLDLQLELGICYLLHIAIEPEHRGKGHGAALYEIVEGIAKSLGCKEVRQTPSGWTHTGETRMRYLVRRGWHPDGAEVVKRIEQPEKVGA
jgi:GNAT superfamily N-acetyltransferase